MKIKLVIVVLFLTGNLIFAGEEEGFKPHGSPFAKVFFNYHTELTDSNTISTFQITRAYLGYKYKLSEEFSTKINIDVGNPKVNIGDSLSGKTSQQITAFLKVASVTYKSGNLKLSAGLIGIYQHKLSEDIWEHRYLYKSIQDEYKLSTSADLGINATYKVTDFLSLDLTVRNGEGYKYIKDSDNAFNTAFGFTLKPFEGLTFRGFYDYIERSEIQTTVSHFVYYEVGDLTVGGEYDMQFNNKDKKDHTLNALSVFALYDITKEIEVFGRFDMLSSNKLSGDTENWNYAKDESVIIGGVQYSPIKYVKVALNYQGFIPADDSKDPMNFIYVNFQFKF